MQNVIRPETVLIKIYKSRGKQWEEDV